MSERRDGPLCADCGQHDGEPQAPAPAVVAVPHVLAPAVMAVPQAPAPAVKAGPQETDEEPEEMPAGFVPGRVGCRTELRGWAGGHLHGAVRPRRRSAGHGRPPGRWC